MGPSVFLLLWKRKNAHYRMRCMLHFKLQGTSDMCQHHDHPYFVSFHRSDTYMFCLNDTSVIKFLNYLLWRVLVNYIVRSFVHYYCLWLHCFLVWWWWWLFHILFSHIGCSFRDVLHILLDFQLLL